MDNLVTTENKIDLANNITCLKEAVSETIFCIYWYFRKLDRTRTSLYAKNTAKHKLFYFRFLNALRGNGGDFNDVSSQFHRYCDILQLIFFCNLPFFPSKFRYLFPFSQAVAGDEPFLKVNDSFSLNPISVKQIKRKGSSVPAESKHRYSDKNLCIPQQIVGADLLVQLIT